MKPMWFTPVSCHLLWFTFTKATINTIVSVIRGNVQEFKSTAKKGQEQQRSGGARDWLKPKNLGDMAGTKDHIIIYCSFAISCITAAVGVFVMVSGGYNSCWSLHSGTGMDGNWMVTWDTSLLCFHFQ